MLTDLLDQFSFCWEQKLPATFVFKSVPSVYNVPNLITLKRKHCLCVCCCGMGRFWPRACSSLLMKGRERDSSMAKTQDWRLNRVLVLARLWHKSGASNFLSLWLNVCNNKKEKKNRGSLLSVLNVLSDPLCSIKVIFFWKYFRKDQRQWGDFLYIWKFIQNFPRCSKPFCNWQLEKDAFPMGFLLQ